MRTEAGGLLEAMTEATTALEGWDGRSVEEAIGPALTLANLAALRPRRIAPDDTWAAMTASATTVASQLLDTSLDAGARGDTAAATMASRLAQQIFEALGSLTAAARPRRTTR